MKQTIIYKLNPNFEQEHHLHNLCSIATKLYNTDNLSLRKIAIKFSVSKEFIRKILIKNGIKRRTKTENTSFERKYFIDEDIFENINTDEKAYWLGFIYADGNVWKNRLRIVLHNKDIELLERFKKFIGYKGNIKNLSNYSEISLWNKKIVHDLSNYGVIPKKSLIIQFPKLSPNFMKPFILGYFDGDGWVSILHNRARIQLGFCSGSNKFIEEIRDYFLNNGFSKRTILKQKKSNTYSILFNGYEGFRVVNFLKNPYLQLNRKLSNVALPSVARITNVCPC